MKSRFRWWEIIFALQWVFVVLISCLLPIVDFNAASAGQVSSRFVQLTSSTINATGVTYNVSFKPTVTSTIGGIVVDFCVNSPVIGNTSCTYASGFNLGGTPSVSGLSGFSTSTGSWGATSSASGAQGGAGAGASQVLIYTNATPQTPTGTSTAINFQITGVTNPSSTGTVYARIVTFDTQAHTANYTISGTTRAASFVGQIDYGGAAISITNVVQVTATVQETLTFCVSKAAPGTGCSGTTNPTLTLGNGGSPSVLDTGGPYTDTAYTQISTNAVSNVNVNMKTNNTCSGMSRDGGATCPIAGNGAFGALAAGSGKFGLLVANGSGGTGTVAANSNYGPTASNYGMGANVTTTYGDTIEATSGATKDVNSLLTFAASAGTSTPAGVYTVNESLVATGTY